MGGKALNLCRDAPPRLINHAALRAGLCLNHTFPLCSKRLQNSVMLQASPGLSSMLRPKSTWQRDHVRPASGAANQATPCAQLNRTQALHVEIDFFHTLCIG